MNDKRREMLKRAASLLQTTSGLVSSAIDGEEDALDNMANGSNANIGFEKQIWDAACVLFGGGISPQQDTEKRKCKNCSRRKM